MPVYRKTTVLQSYPLPVREFSTLPEASRREDLETQIFGQSLRRTPPQCVIFRHSASLLGCRPKMLPWPTAGSLRLRMCSAPPDEHLAGQHAHVSPLAAPPGEDSGGPAARWGKGRVRRQAPIWRGLGNECTPAPNIRLSPVPASSPNETWHYIFPACVSALE